MNHETLITLEKLIGVDRNMHLSKPFYFMKAGVLLFISSGTTNFSDQYFMDQKAYHDGEWV